VAAIQNSGEECLSVINARSLVAYNNFASLASIIFATQTAFSQKGRFICSGG